MLPITLTHGKIDDFDAVQADTGALALTLIPELGGKISSLCDMRSGREWLWRHPRLPYQRVPHGTVYVETSDTGGWDECFPSVAACAYPVPPWQGVPVQDHGELWSHPAALTIHEASDTLRLHTRWQGVLLPYTFERTLTLWAGTARMHCAYTITNHTEHPLPYIWSAHPLLAIEPGMRLELPAEAQFHGSRPEAGAPERELRWPLTLAAGGRAFNLDSMPPRDAGVAIKLWSEQLVPGAGWAALHATNGALHMRWDPAVLPQVACWLNLGAFGFDGGAPYYNLGLEPCIGAQDSLAQAVNDYKLFATVPARSSQKWWLEVELSV